jgi:phosphatidylglycerol:prolipoprotein diacylglycerol transferase
MTTQADFLVDFPGLGINDLPINRAAFHIFSRPVYWYGLLIALAIVICLVIATRQAKHFNLKADDIMDTFIALIPMMIIFARLYYVVFQWDYYKQDLGRILNTSEGGLAFYGGVIGGALAILLVTRIKKIPVSRLLDFMVVYVPLGQAIGRWGNFFNQEAFGTATNLPWGMHSSQTEATLFMLGSANPTSPVHPTFLYEFIANLIIFVILLRVRRKSRFPFQVFLSYLMMYGMVRFFVEGIRTDALLIPGTEIRISMVLSALMVLVSAVLLIYLRRRAERIELAKALENTGAAMPTVLPNVDEVAADDNAFIEISNDAFEAYTTPSIDEKPINPEEPPAESGEPSEESGETPAGSGDESADDPDHTRPQA